MKSDESATVFDQPLPYLTGDGPGLGGTLKQVPEDFLVEEIPAYEPSGQGDHLYLWIEKRGMGAEFFVRQIAQRLGIASEGVGTAGLKDRHAVTRQWVSVPATAEARLNQLGSDDLRVLKTSRHGNKLKPGHLRGNRFELRIREIDPGHAPTLQPNLQLLRERGLPNFYGEQRFGREGETLTLGLKLLRREATTSKKFLRKLALSAVQSALFNAYLAERMNDRLLQRVLPGDVMAKWPFGGMFTVTDVAAEQARFDGREIVSAGPMFGVKTFPAADEALLREQALLNRAGLTTTSFAGFGKLLQGTRRHNLVYVDDLAGRIEGNDAVLAFSLPAGSYATVLLREIMKSDEALTPRTPGV